MVSRSPRFCILIYVILVGLTVGNFFLSFLQLGLWHLVVGGGIAVVSASLIALFFMHLSRSGGRIWLAAFLGICWLLLLYSLSLCDYFTRSTAVY